ncbi:hypothetical protein NLX67_00935 [Domibacillus sp. A3M-37]|uniref:hypothetical protein n=1 Tax=Domibacillus sp. A3M-37 TaxID=2962037 RepID=UPI0020B806B3|nr:hypothetical protein [Domibacillus sp. A3M-37]MCP3760959.1 hypothetical protein [Domibacillus sp. A3M-37]
MKIDRQMKEMVLVLLTVFFLAGCSAQTKPLVTTTTENPTAKEVLELDPSADIFQLEGVIYKANVDWVDQLSLTKGEKAGEIEQNVTVPEDFGDGSATHLPNGTVIFKAAEQQDVLIVDVDGEEQYYLAQMEG